MALNGSRIEVMGWRRSPLDECVAGELTPEFIDELFDLRNWPVRPIMPDEKDYDIVSKPKHYNCMGEKDKDGRPVHEPVKVIESWGLADGFYLGSALKYILRAKHKGNERQDLEKALWYLERLRDYRMAQAKEGKGEFLLPLKVGWAWELSKDLFLAIEHIANDHPGGAAWKVAEELAVMGMAEEMAKEEDEEILDQVVSIMAKRAASFTQKHPPKPLGELAAEQDSLVKIANEMKPIAQDDKKGPHDKYEGKADHEAGGWSPAVDPAEESWGGQDGNGTWNYVVLTRKSKCGGMYTHERFCARTGKPMETLTIGPMPLDAMRKFCQEQYGLKNWGPGRLSPEEIGGKEG
jgi:hypothetical protein